MTVVLGPTGPCTAYLDQGWQVSCANTIQQQVCPSLEVAVHASVACDPKMMIVAYPLLGVGSASRHLQI